MLKAQLEKTCNLAIFSDPGKKLGWAGTPQFTFGGQLIGTSFVLENRCGVLLRINRLSVINTFSMITGYHDHGRGWVVQPDDTTHTSSVNKTVIRGILLLLST